MFKLRKKNTRNIETLSNIFKDDIKTPERLLLLLLTLNISHFTLLLLLNSNK